MDIIAHNINNSKIAEIVSDLMLIDLPEDGLDLLGNIYYKGFDKLIIYERNINPDFFDLSTGIADQVIQKFSNHKMPLAIVGDFLQYESKNIRNFMRECNRGNQVIFVNSVKDALSAFS